MSEFSELTQNAKAWPFEEARKLVKRIGGKAPKKGYVLFETGYGPSGLPHIGTFGEVLRTTWRGTDVAVKRLPKGAIGYSGHSIHFKHIGTLPVPGLA